MIAPLRFFLVAGALALAACERTPGAGAEVTRGDGPAFVGAWAADEAGCRVPQEQMGAPHLFTAEGYNQHEAHCTFTSVEESGANAWRIAGDCTIEGDEQTATWDLAVEDDRMTMTPGGLPFIRCPN
ncbi:MAG: hypothetical protein AB7P07_03535 [Hyphomonadaceae bacterium]